MIVVAHAAVVAPAIRGANRGANRRTTPRYPLRRGSGQNVRRLRALPFP